MFRVQGAMHVQLVRLVWRWLSADSRQGHSTCSLRRNVPLFGYRLKYEAPRSSFVILVTPPPPKKKKKEKNKQQRKQ